MLVSKVVILNSRQKITKLLVAWQCNFTLKHYFEVLDYAKEKYSICPVKEFPKLKKKERIIILRHDVDLSLHHALKMARAEAEHGLRATYFVMLRSQFYNVLSEENLPKFVRKIAFHLNTHVKTYSS